ncbi:MAG: SPFH domain-containing protein [Acidobacteriales bacterium]|nr:SPFH domain-containing protein [Terriglobales bacterium]
MIQDFVRSLRPWFTVLPWQEGLRVRLGKHVKVLKAGLHWKIPLLDTIFVMPMRMRTLTTPRQTVTTSDGACITFAMNIAFIVRDIQKLYETLHAPAETISDLAQSLAAQWIATHSKLDATPAAVSKAVDADLHLGRYGLECKRVYVSEFAVVRTYRLMGDDNYGQMPSINTSRPVENGDTLTPASNA